MTEVKRFAVGDLLTELTGHPWLLAEATGPTRVVRISDDRQRIWMECNNEDWGWNEEPFECKIELVDNEPGYEGSVEEVATFTREDVYLEYSARDIEEEYLWGETYEEMEARTEPYRGPGGLLGGGTH